MWLAPRTRQIRWPEEPPCCIWAATPVDQPPEIMYPKSKAVVLRLRSVDYEWLIGTLEDACVVRSHSEVEKIEISIAMLTYGRCDGQEKRRLDTLQLGVSELRLADQLGKPNRIVVFAFIALCDYEPGVILIRGEE